MLNPPPQCHTVTPTPLTRPLTAQGASLLRYLRPDRLMLMLVRHGERGGPPVPGLAGIPYEHVLLGQHNASISLLSLSAEGRLIIRLANCTRHLRPSQIGGDVLE